MKLIKALRYRSPSSLAWVGAGGKTSTIFKAARELLAIERPEAVRKTVLVTTTTHFGTWQTTQADHSIIINSLGDAAALEKDLPGGILLLSSGESNNRLAGLDERVLARIHSLAENQHLPLLIEADGAHGLPLKAPDEQEPVIPGFVQAVVVVAGLQGLGKPLTDSYIHRAVRFAEISGVHLGESVTGDALTRVLLSERGGLKNIPPNARRIVLLNQADSPALVTEARHIAERLIAEFHAVIIAGRSAPSSAGRQDVEGFQDSAHIIHAVIEPVAGIILAAGGSSRFGAPKQLLTWRGEPIIRHVARVALEGRLSPVIVVLGSSAEQIAPAINDLPLRIVINNGWENGMSSSIVTGLNEVKNEVGAIVFIQADQPQCPPALICTLSEAHQASMSPIIAPHNGEQRGNPVLFDASTFDDLAGLKGDTGGRAVFDRYPIEWVNWQDRGILLDIDTPEDYHELLRLYPQEEK